MDMYTKIIEKDSSEGSFCRAIHSIHKNNFEKAQAYIDLTRKFIDTELVGLFFFL